MRVLAIGAHPDDIEIACSGTLAKCVKRGEQLAMKLVIDNVGVAPIYKRLPLYLRLKNGDCAQTFETDGEYSVLTKVKII